jgi:hypothetical protein
MEFEILKKSESEITNHLENITKNHPKSPKITHFHMKFSADRLFRHRIGATNTIGYAFFL